MISAIDELKHVADSVSEKEAEAYLAAPELLAACCALLALVDADPRARLYDSDLMAVVKQVRDAVEGLPDLPCR
jgi:hypothetical protein